MNAGISVPAGGGGSVGPDGGAGVVLCACPAEAVPVVGGEGRAAGAAGAAGFAAAGVAGFGA
jgi:hypothetical protein